MPIVLLLTAHWFDLYGTGGRSSAMGGAMTAAADDESATFYNPALLATLSEPTVSLTANLAAPSLQVAFSKTPAVEAALPPTYYGFNLALAVPFGGKAKKRVALGVDVFSPGSNLLRIRLRDPFQPHFYMYDSGPSVLVIAAALAARPWDWIQIGVGVQILAQIGAPTNISLDVVNSRFPQKELDAQLFPAFAAIAGLSVKPLPGLTLGVSYRGSLNIKVDIPANISIDGLDATLGLRVSGVAQWQPHAINFGAAYKLQTFPMSFALDATYALWSLAPDPSLSVELNLGGPDADKLGISGILNAPAKGQERTVELGFSNTLSVRAGTEVEATRWLLVRAGYNFRPTPAPLQTSGTNILDNDAHTISLGAGFRFKDPLEAFAGTFNIDVTGQLGLLPQRQHLKDTGTDPIGDYAAGGNIFGASVLFRYVFGAGA